MVPPPTAAVGRIYDSARRGREQRWRAFTLADQHGRADALEDFIACTVPVFFYVEPGTPTARRRPVHCATSPPSSAKSRSSG